MPTESDANLTKRPHRTWSLNPIHWLSKSSCETSRSKAGRDSPVPQPNRLTDKKRKHAVSVNMPPADEKTKDYQAVFNSQLQQKKESNPYPTYREKLLQTEESQEWCRKARETASEAERRANGIVLKIREHERENHFGNKASEAIPEPDKLDMGGQFLTNKERIESSKLFKISMMLPKGCHQHLHFNAELQPEMLIEKAREKDNMFIRSTRPLLSPKDYDEAEMVFNILPVDTPEADLFSPSYNPEFKAAGSQPWMRWNMFRKIFAKKRAELSDPDQKDAEKWIQHKMIISEPEVYGIGQTVNGIWARFNQSTRCFKGLLNYESVYRWYIRAAIEDMIDEKVMYAELRPMLMDKFIPTDDGIGKCDHFAQMDILLEEVQKKQAELKKHDELHGTREFDKFPFGLKIIYCTPRSIPKARMEAELQDCLKLKLKYPNLICGFDLVGAEDRPNHIGFYMDELSAFVETCKAMEIEIPFMFHAGETLLDTGGSRYARNSNLYDSVLLNAKRIGHGYSLMKHPLLIEKFKEKDICIELCPISNELLHLCRNVKEHVFPQLLAAGIPCTINSDNPSLFSSSLSHEYYQVMVGSPTMSVHGWRQLIEWSIQYSCLSDAQKVDGEKIFARDWKGFCQWVVDEYGAYADGLDIE
ncbi:hypothetical protein BDY21DRAFT_141847 [Lineolata rhizophorae]|uniref:adenosine deaminase n=1 Tax=Lineolata rhizophorae TaxID=578093 RepID=A0A6A6NPC5_9PEZI|nr:hypothetical protein BDY21DRAFT_141847 [Lineolata rhizophorae]